MIHESNLYCQVECSLAMEKHLYILDTDDMVIEDTSYDFLYENIKNGNVHVENIVNHSDELFCSASSYTFFEIKPNFSTIDGNLIYQSEEDTDNSIVTINSKSYKLTVNNRERGSYGYINNILLNNEIICAIRSDDGVDTFGWYCGIPYIAGLGNKYIIHFYISDGDDGFELVLVIDKNGDLHDIFPLEGFEGYFCNFRFKPKSDIFRIKYKTIFKERF